MAIYVRNKEGDLTPLNIPAIKGKDGITPKIKVGEVNTLPAGEKATVEMGGDVENPVLNFGIPKGRDGDGASNNFSLVTNEIIDGNLTLTTDKYQTTNMENNTTIILPEVEEFTEIYLLFNITDTITLTLPKMHWDRFPNMKSNTINKFIFTYINGNWIGEHFCYYPSDNNRPIMNGLVCWLDAHDIDKYQISNNTIWRNKVGDRNNALIRPQSGNEIVSVSHGYFRTNRNAYVELPSFNTDNDSGISVFLDAKINSQPNEQYNRIFTLQQRTASVSGISMNCGITEFGYIRIFNTNVDSTLDINQNYPIPMRVGCSTKFIKNFSTDKITKYSDSTIYRGDFNNNFLNAENPSTITKADISYGLVLIYNRDLSEEEMLYNYMYSLSIDRG